MQGEQQICVFRLLMWLSPTGTEMKAARGASGRKSRMIGRYGEGWRDGSEHWLCLEDVEWAVVCTLTGPRRDDEN